MFNRSAGTIIVVFLLVSSLGTGGAAKGEFSIQLADNPERRDFIYSLSMVLATQTGAKIHPQELDRVLPKRLVSPNELGSKISGLYNRNITVSCSQKFSFEFFAKKVEAVQLLAIKIPPNENKSTWVTLVGYSQESTLHVSDSKATSDKVTVDSNQVIAYCGVTVAASQDSFAKLAASVDALIAIPDDFQEVPPVKQEDVMYHKAWKHKREKFEIRIRIDNMAPMLAEKKRLESTGTGKMVDPNKSTPMFYQTMLMNIAQSDQVRAQNFPADGVRAEFNADSGMTGFVKGNSGFSKGYANVMANYVQRNDTGVIYIFYLFDDVEKGIKLMQEYFYVAKFDGNQ